MSSRQLRKLQQQRELEFQTKLQAESENESEEEIAPPSKAKPSLFATLAVLEDQADEDEDEESENEAIVETTAQRPDSPAPTKAAKKNKKAKKKAKKAKDKDTETKVIDGDDIDAALEKLALKNPSGQNGQEERHLIDPAYERVCQLLGVSSNHLKVGTEMRNLFGKGVMDNHDDAGGAVPRRARRQHAAQQVDLETALKGRHAPGKGLPELTLRRNIFIAGKDDWPRAAGTLKWEIIEDDGFSGRDHAKREVYGRFVHDQAYQNLQQNFQAFVEMGDPQNLIGLLQRNPYHISLLIQVSKVAKDQSDHSLSSDLLERALFTFARATNSAFATALTAGKLRLDFSMPENRELWLAAYQYIKSLIMKGTYRTALEWGKLLLSLSPEQDPYCMRLQLHLLALRGGEPQWLIDFYTSPFGVSGGKSVSGRQSRADSHITPSLALAAIQLKDGANARRYLRGSMTTLPWLFASLLSALNLDAPPSIWGIQARSESEKLFTELYISQCKDLWNTPEATSLLMEVAHIIPPIKADEIAVLSNDEMTLDVVRFIYLDNNPALMRLVPSALLHRENNSDSDPLPPYENTFSYPSQRLVIERGNTGQAGFNRGFDNPLAAIARLFPGFGGGGGGGGGGEGPGEAAGNEEAVNAQLRRGLEDIVRGDDNEEGPENENGAHGQGQRMPRSVAQSLLEMLGWGGSREEGGEGTAGQDGYVSDDGSASEDGEFEDAVERHDRPVGGDR